MRIVLMTALFAAFVACSGGSPSGPGGGNPGGGNPGGGNPGGGNPGGGNPGSGNTVSLSASSFVPGTLTVSAGTAVTWQNASGVAHTVTPTTHSAWTTVTLNSGQNFSVNFPNAGTYNYRCDLHSGMTGQIVVQ